MFLADFSPGSILENASQSAHSCGLTEYSEPPQNPRAPHLYQSPADPGPPPLSTRCKDFGNKKNVSFVKGACNYYERVERYPHYPTARERDGIASLHVLMRLSAARHHDRTSQALRNNPSYAVFCSFSLTCSFLIARCEQRSLLININPQPCYNSYSLNAHARTFSPPMRCGKPGVAPDFYPL